MLETTILTERQKEILELKLKGLSNHEIADTLRVSDEYISQALKLVSSKIQTVEDSIKLFRDLGLIESGPSFKLSEEGMNALKVRRAHLRHFITTVTYPRKPMTLCGIGKPICGSPCPYIDNMIIPLKPWGLKKRTFNLALVDRHGIKAYSNQLERCM
jgi:predicted DNA-binding protein YlxM (UPF0122 family)